MAVVGGDIKEIQWSNSQVRSGSGTFFGKAGESFTIDTGGLRNEDEDEGLDGGGRNIQTKVQKKWMVEGVFTYDTIITRELDVLSELSAATEDTVFTISHVSGAVWKGTGSVVGDVKADLKAATVSFKASGALGLKPIVG